MTVRISCLCPYCDCSQTFNLEDTTSPQIVLCYPEEGGCNNYYVVELEKRYEVKEYGVNWKNDFLVNEQIKKDLLPKGAHT